MPNALTADAAAPPSLSTSQTHTDPGLMLNDDVVDTLLPGLIGSPTPAVSEATRLLTSWVTTLLAPSGAAADTAAPPQTTAAQTAARCSADALCAMLWPSNSTPQKTSTDALADLKTLHSRARPDLASSSFPDFCQTALCEIVAALANAQRDSVSASVTPRSTSPRASSPSRTSAMKSTAHLSPAWAAGSRARSPGSPPPNRDLVGPDGRRASSVLKNPQLWRIRAEMALQQAGASMAGSQTGIPALAQFSDAPGASMRDRAPSMARVQTAAFLGQKPGASTTNGPPRRISMAQAGASLAGGGGGLVELMPMIQVLPDETPSVRSNGDGPAFEPRTTLEATYVDDCDDGTSELNQYVILQPLGAGAQGEVFLAMDTEKNELRAVKAVPRPGGAGAGAAVGRPLNAARRRQREQLEREVAIMKRCRHKHVVALYEVIDDPEQERMHLVMQYVEHGPIASVGADGGVSRTVEPVQLARFARQLAAGLEYLHRRGIIHRDIKPENILLGADEQVYLADFGTAEVFERGARAGVEGTRGTLAFVAPELLEEPRDCPLPGSPGIGVRSPDAVKPRRLRSCGVNEVDGEAVDVWALGVTLYALLYGKLPFFADDARELFAKILMEPLRFGAQPKAACDSSDRLSFRPTDESQSSEGDGGGLSTLVQLVDTHERHPGGPAASASGPESTLCGPSFIGDDDDTDDDEIAFASSCGGSQGASLATQWSRVLAGMLKKDPRRRWTLKRVRRALRDMEGGDVDAGISTAAESVAISALRPRGSIFGVRRPSV